MEDINLLLSTGELCLTIEVLSVSKYVDKHFFSFMYSGSVMFGTRHFLRQPEVLQLANECGTCKIMSPGDVIGGVGAVCHR